MKLNDLSLIRTRGRWEEFSKDFDTQSDFSKFFVREKLVPWNHSYRNYALEGWFFFQVP